MSRLPPLQLLSLGIAMLLAALVVTGKATIAPATAAPNGLLGSAVSQATPPGATPTPPIGESGGYSQSFTVSGAVASPASYALTGLQALPSMTVTAQYDAGQGQETHTFQGVRLYDLLMAASPRFDNTSKNSKIDWYIHFDAIDGYQALLAWGEIDPEEEGKNVLIAYAEDGQLLGPGYGMAELIVPGDSTNSRYVASITDITVAPAGS